ncbi:MAG: hypothetical protein ACFFAN_15620 [Promethearchaeota archaeon]
MWNTGFNNSSAVFNPFKVTSNIYNPPYLHMFILKVDGSYKQEELRNITLNEEEKIYEKNIIDISNLFPFRLGLGRLKQ